MLTCLCVARRVLLTVLVLLLYPMVWVSPLRGQQDVELVFDDGTFEQFVGFDNGQGILANGPFVPPTFPATLTEVRFETNGLDAGTEVAVNVYVDPTGQADRPAIGLLIGSVRTTLASGGQFQSVDVSNLGVVLSAGNLFVGLEHVVADINIGLGVDNDGPPNRAWLDSNLDGIFSPLNFTGVLAIRAVVRLAGGGGSAARSTFDSDADGWTITPDASTAPNPIFSLTEGNPAGSIGGRDTAGGAYWYYIAPAKFLGDQSSAFGRALTFDLRIPSAGRLDVPGVRLVGGGITLVTDFAAPNGTWSSRSVPLTEAGWTRNSRSGAPATESDMRTVLSALTELGILGEYQTSPDRSELDNVVLSGTGGGGGGGGNVAIFPAATTPQFVGNEFWVDINVGDNNSPVSNLFGVSFELNFSQTGFIDVVTPNSSNVVPGSFLGSDLVFVPNVDEAGGKVSIGISRKAGAGGVNGSGVVARTRFVSRANTPDGTQVNYSINNVSANDPDGSAILLNPGNLTVTINSGILVWPGDTNNDRVVNQADVLPIGLFWNRTGPVRANANASWTGQVATPWTQPNATFADANGDGAVNQADVLPIGLNWSRTHTAPAKDTDAAAVARAFKIHQVPTLGILIDGDADPGQELFIDIQAKDVAGLFGLSLELVYTPTARLEPMTVEAGSFMGNDLVFFPNIDASTGRVGVGISRKAGQGSVSGTGVVARIRVKIPNNAVVGNVVNLTLENVAANDSVGNGIPLQVDNHDLVTSVDDIRSDVLPVEFALGQNYPNPFNPGTRIQYDLPMPSMVKIVIYNPLGQKVRTLLDTRIAAGSHVIAWDGRMDNGQQAASGIYIYRLQAERFVQNRKMLLLR